MIYLVVGEHCSGVMISQALDTCKYLSSLHNKKIKFVAFISGRDFFRQRKKFKRHYPNSIILPMFPKLKNWQKNYWLLLIIKLLFLSKNKMIITRGPIAGLLGLKLKKDQLVDWVCYDGRGAYSAEWNEYDVVKDEQLKKDIYKYEQSVVIQSDFRLAVSNKLVDYWRSAFQYEGNAHVVIPCTLSKIFNTTLPSYDTLQATKLKYGYQEEDIIFVYSGSSAGWQSLELLNRLFEKLLFHSPNAKVLLLSNLNKALLPVINKYPDQVQVKWVKAHEVFSILSMCDYGVMVRNDSVTNQVAAPTKFAEYLASGLQVIISNKIGDYSEIVEQEQLGYVSSNNDLELFEFSCLPLPYEEKRKLNEFARNSFSKNAFTTKYQQLLN